MPTPEEPDFPVGHPARHDYDPDSAEAKEWNRKRGIGMGERDFAVDHPGAHDTPGNKNHLVWEPGVDPNKPDHEPFTGRSPDVAKRVRKAREKLYKAAKPSPAVEPTVAPPPPDTPGSTAEPPGQPGLKK